MTKPFKCKRMLVKIQDPCGATPVVVGVVEGMSIEFIREGGIEPHYCSETGKHAIGTKHATFSIRRWMYLDEPQNRLLYDLFNNKTQFCLEFGLWDVNEPPDYVEGSVLMLSDCVGYRWRPVLGAANDIIAEELIGECVNWCDTRFEDELGPHEIG